MRTSGLNGSWRGTDADFPACELYRDTLSQNLIKALQKPHNLLRRMILSTSHNNRAFPPTMGELRLSNQVDAPQGVMPRPQWRLVRLGFMKDASLAPLVSVVIPAYNQPDLLVRALQGLSRQTYGNVEVIISDDNSPTDLRNHVELSSVNPDLRSKIRWFRQEKNLGAYGNSKFSLQFAVGRFLVFLPHDDWWVSDTFIEDSANAMMANDRCHVAISNSAIETPNGLDGTMMNLHTNESDGWKYLDGADFVNNHLFTNLHPAYSAVLFDLAKLRDLGYEETWLLPNVYRPLDIEPDEGFIAVMLAAWSSEVAIRGKVVSVRGTPADSWSRSIFWEKKLTFGMFLTYMNFAEFLKKLPDDAPYKFAKSLISSRAYRPRTFNLKFAKYLSATPAYLVTYIRGILHLGSIRDNVMPHFRRLRTRLRSL